LEIAPSSTDWLAGHEKDAGEALNHEKVLRISVQIIALRALIQKDFNQISPRPPAWAISLDFAAGRTAHFFGFCAECGRLKRSPPVWSDVAVAREPGIHRRTLTESSSFRMGGLLLFG